MGRVFALANQKGGVGKTTTAVNLGAYLAAAGKRVLLVDLDPQANATSSLGIDRKSLPASTYEVLLGGLATELAIVVSKQVRLDLLPAAPALAGAEVELVGLMAREQRLGRALEPVADLYDYVFVDCPPSLGLLTVNALTAARNGVLIPVQCEYLALEGIGQLTQTLNLVRSSLFPEMRIRGVILTMFDIRTNLSADVVREVRKFFPNLVYDSVIPRSVRLAEAPSYGLPINQYAPESNPAKAYAGLTLELLNQDGGFSAPPLG